MLTLHLQTVGFFHLPFSIAYTFCWKLVIMHLVTRIGDGKENHTSAASSNFSTSNTTSLLTSDTRVSYTSNNSAALLDILKFHSIILLPNGDSIISHRLQVFPTRLFPNPHWRCKLQISLCLMEPSFPWPSSLSWINLLQRLTELRKTIYLLDY